MIAIYIAIVDTPEQERLLVEIYNANRQIMFKYARAILSDDYDAEDAVHDAFMSAAKIIETFRPLSCNERQSLCVTIVTNRARNMRRDSHSKQMTPIEDDILPSDDLEITDRMISVENVRRLSALMKSLPDTYRDAAVLRLVFELKYKEIATALALTEQAARVRVHRARNMLIALLRKEGI